MVGKMNSLSRKRLPSLLDSASSALDVHSKLENLRQLNLNLSEEDDPTSVSELLPRLFELQSDHHSAVRKCVAEIIGEIGLRHLEFVPEIVPVLMGVLEDRAPAVARQAITCGINLFRSTLGKLAVKGLYTSELDETLTCSWSLMLDFKEKMYTIAFEPGSGGVRLLALKFVEAVILLYTPDSNGSPEPPTHEGELEEFNIGWLRGGHPVLNAGDLSIEASKRLGLLLDQLRLPTVKTLNNLVIIVLINSLATVAKRRPPYYGRILPVLLGLGPSGAAIEVMHVSGANHALKNAFLTCLKCTHPGAAPWRDRLVGALKEMKAGGVAEDVLHQILKSNGSTGKGEEMSIVAMDGKIIKEEVDAVPNELGKKRSGSKSSSELAEDNDVSGKRAKSTPSVSEESTKGSSGNVRVQDDIPSEGSSVNRVDDDIGPVQQLVAMFGALVAQGEKAVGSLEILISSISADLLAEVVMANMRYLPTSYPTAEADDESLVNMTIVGSNTQAKYPSSFLSNVLSLSTSFPQIASQLNAHQSASEETEDMPQDQEDIHVASVVDTTVICTGISQGENEILPVGLLPESNVVSSGMEIDIPSDNNDAENIESEIPGLDSFARNDGLSETMGASSFVSTDIEDASQEQVTSLDGSSTLDLHPAISTDRSEEHSPKAVVTDSINVSSSTIVPVGLPSASVLPKMLAPVVDLAEEHKDQLQNLAYMRIVEAYKQIAVAGGSQVRFSLLAYLGVESPAELELWKLLQKHILSDYVTYEGHELTLRVLYRLFGEIEEERDFFSSTTAASVYEMFLLAVAETLRDSFPPSDKSLSRLLGEAPYLPKSVLNLLESLCSPGSSDKAEEFQSGDRVTQGLSTVWSLILQRPPIREVCLKIALQSAVHHLEEVRMKAIRLVANKLYPITSIAQQIEEFALEKLLSIVSAETEESVDPKGSTIEPQKDSNMEKLPIDHQSASEDISSDAERAQSSLSEAQQCMSLYFALCTKKHSLFRQIFVIYKSSSKAVKQAVHRHIPILVRTMGSSSELLEIISDPPSGSDNLLIQVLQTLTNGAAPSTELLFTIRKLYNSKLKDMEILIPVLPFLSRDEVLPMFPRLVNLPPEKFQVALSRILQGSPHSGPVLTPAEVLIAIHGIDPEKDGIPLKKITDACNACFEQRQIFTQQVIAKVLNQLVEQIPMPLLFMRTVLQAIGAFPALVDFIMEILSRLVTKQIWKYPKLWVGFLKCALLTKPQSFSLLLQLPPPQLENALNRTAPLKAPLVAHASQPNIKSSLPRSILAVLGIATDPQTSTSNQAFPQTSTSNQAHPQTSTSNQAQTSQPQTGDTSTSDKEEQTEKPKESSSAS
ncbi:HEAT repeat-containing protein [Euphorbia peplus]|nr:HEAT repeat-containing protein [Euphorbia peplus]